MLALEEQFRLAQTQVDFLDRVTAAVFNVAIVKYQATQLDDPVKQAQRVKLAEKALLDPASVTRVFAWVCVADQSLSDVNDLTDEFLMTICTGYFDPISLLLIPAVT